MQASLSPCHIAIADASSRANACWPTSNNQTSISCLLNAFIITDLPSDAFPLLVVSSEVVIVHHYITSTQHHCSVSQQRSLPPFAAAAAAAIAVEMRQRSRMTHCADTERDSQYLGDSQNMRFRYRRALISSMMPSAVVSANGISST